MALLLKNVIKLCLNELVLLNLHQNCLNILQFFLADIPSRFSLVLFADIETFAESLNFLWCFAFFNQLLQFLLGIWLTDTDDSKLELCWLVFHFSWISLFFLEIALIGRVNHSIWLDVCENFHYGFFILKKQCIIKDLLVVIVTSEIIDGRHIKLRLSLVEEYLVGKNLGVLWINQYIFCCQYELTFLRLTLWGYDWHVVPYYISIKVFLNKDHFFVERNQKCFFLYLIYLGACKDTKFKDVVNGIDFSLHLFDFRITNNS